MKGKILFIFFAVILAAVSGCAGLSSSLEETGGKVGTKLNALAEKAEPPLEKAGQAVSAKLDTAAGHVEKGVRHAETEITAQIAKLSLSGKRKDYPSDAAFANFRAVPGTSAVYRSCHPARADVRSPYAARLAEQAGTAAIVDLADTPAEQRSGSDGVPWYEYFIDRGDSTAAALSAKFDDPDNLEKLRAAFVFMAAHKGPFLIHCTDGVERTGFAAMLLGALAGSGEDVLAADYMQSYVDLYGFKSGEDRYEIISSRAEDMLDYIRGGDAGAPPQKAAETFLRTKAGLTAAEIEAVKQALR